MRRVAIKLAYEGTEFFGYQGQRTKRTVQDELEKGLQKIFGFRINTFVQEEQIQESMLTDRLSPLMFQMTE